MRAYKIVSDHEHNFFALRFFYDLLHIFADVLLERHILQSCIALQVEYLRVLDQIVIHTDDHCLYYVSVKVIGVHYRLLVEDELQLYLLPDNEPRYHHKV